MGRMLNEKELLLAMQMEGGGNAPNADSGVMAMPEPLETTAPAKHADTAHSAVGGGIPGAGAYAQNYAENYADRKAAYETARTENDRKRSAYESAEASFREMEECVDLWGKQVTAIREEYRRTGNAATYELLQKAQGQMEQMLMEYLPMQESFDTARREYETSRRTYEQAEREYNAVVGSFRADAARMEENRNAMLSSYRASYRAWPAADQALLQIYLDNKIHHDENMAALYLDAERRLTERYGAETVERMAQQYAYDRQAEAAAADKETEDADLRELETWSQEDRALLADYVTNRFYGDEAGAVKYENARAALWAKYGRQRVQELAETYIRVMNRELAAQMEQEADALTQSAGGRILGSALAVPANVLGGIAGAAGFMGNLLGGSGRYSTMDPNAAGGELAAFGRQVTAKVAEHIRGNQSQEELEANLKELETWTEEDRALLQSMVDNRFAMDERMASAYVAAEQTLFRKYGAEKVRTMAAALAQSTGKITAGDVGAVVYSAGMSALENLARIAIGGGAGSLAIAAMGSFTNTVKEASGQGATPMEAAALGMITGSIEVLTEKVSLDRLLKQAGGGSRSFKEILKAALISGGIEVTEEELSFLGQLMAEAAVLREKSSYNQRIRELTASGMSREEAEHTANLELLKQAGMTAVESFLSGGMMSGATGVAVNTMINIQNRGNVREIGAQLNARENREEDARMMIAAGMNSPEGTAARQAAEQLQGKFFAGKELSDAEMGRLYVAIVETASQEAAKSQTDGNVTEEADPVTEEPVSVTESTDPVIEQEENVNLAEQIRQEENETGGITNEQEAALRYGAGTADRGAGVSDGGSQRNAGAGAPEQAGSLAGRAEGGKPGERSAEAQRIHQIQNLARSLPYISAQEVGVTSGTEMKNLKQIPEEMWEAAGLRTVAEQIRADTGMEPVFVAGRIQAKGAKGKTFWARGVINQNTVVVQADNTKVDAGRIADHEIYHYKSRELPGLHNRIREHIVNTYTEEEFEKILDKYIDGLSGTIQIPADATGEEIEGAIRQIEEEIFADAYAGINAFDAHAEGWTETVHEKMDELYVGKAKLQDNGTRQTNGPNETEKNTAQEDGEEDWLTVSDEEYEERYGRLKPGAAFEEKYSYAGERAENADLEALERAKEMLRAGVANETIRQETGWFRGMDGKWRWEIDDSEMQYHRAGDARYRQMHPEYERHQELMLKFLYGEITAEEDREFRKLDEIWGRENQRLRDRVKLGNARLQNLIQHDALFEAYPWLRGVKVVFDELPAGIMGQYDLNRNAITLSTSLENPMGTLLHEIQHAIQNFEGFSQGTTVGYWDRRIKAGFDSRRRADIQEARETERTIREIQEGEPEFYRDMMELDAMTPDMPRGEIDWDTLEKITEDPPEWQAFDARRDALEEQYGDMKVWDFMDLLYIREKAAKKPGRSARELYLDTAGEIEARDVDNRKNLDEEGRKKRPPRLGGENTVFVEDIDGAAFAELDAQYGPPLQSAAEFDQDTISGNIRQVAQMESVTGITGQEFAKGEVDLITQVETFFDQRGNRAFNPELGEVILDRKGVKSDIAHGIGRKKAAAFAAVPEVIERGLVVDYQKNWKGRGYDTAVVAAPIDIGGQAHMAAIILVRSDRTNRFYVHEVLAMENGALPFKTGARKGDPSGDAPSILSILDRIRDVKNGTGSRERFSVDDSRELSDVEQEAVRIFGITESFEEAGYILPDGRLLRMSDGEHSNERTYDHRAIAMAYGAEVDLDTNHGFSAGNGRYLDAFVEAGNIRFDAGEPDLGMDIGLQLSKTVPLTKAQERTIRDLVEWKETREETFEAQMTEEDFLYTGPLAIRIDFGGDSNYAVGSVSVKDLAAWGKKGLEYKGRKINAGQIIHDVRHFYKTGETVARSNLNQFRYSVDDGEQDYDALERAFAEQQRSAKETFLREKLGDDGYRKYLADQRAREDQHQQEEQQLRDQRKEQAERRKQDAALEAKARRMVETNKRKLHVEAETAKINREEQRRLETETKPAKAKRELKNNLLNLFSIPAGQRGELGKTIDHFADRIIKNGTLTEEDRSAFFDRMYEAGVMTVQAEEYFQEGRRTVAGGKVYVDDSTRADFGDDWEWIRKRAFSAGIYLTRNRSDGGLDVWNHELAELLPGMFDSEETDNRAILERIVQIAEEGKDEKVSLAEYTARLAKEERTPVSEFLDNMERQMDWALRSFANAAEIETQTKEREIRKQANTRRQNIQLQARLAAERQERVEKAQRQRERKELREMQQKTLKALQWLNRNQYRAPEELREVWNEVLGDIDIYAVSAANELNWSNKYNASWRDLAQMYLDAEKNDPNFMPSKELETIVKRLDGTKIEDMDPGALADLYKAAVGLRTEFYNRNNVINDDMQRLFAEVYSDSKKEIEAAPGGFTGKGADKFLNMEQLTPMNVLQRMAGWDPDSTFYSMAKQLEQGERDIRNFTVRSQALLKDFLTEHEDWVKKADGQGKDGLWEEIEIPELIALELGKPPKLGDTIKVWITPAQKVHMYLESKNHDNLRHMTGGRTFADKKLYSEGKRQEAFAQGKTVRLAPETVKAIVANMSEEELELAKLLDSYYNGYATGEINRVSNILYGYDKAMGSHYAPIYTNQNYVKTEFGVFDTTAEGIGNLKGRVYAVNPSYNISAFDAFERNVDHTARFVGMAIPARNWTTLMNWRESHNSTADVITHKWGDEGKRYISDLITRLQAGEKADGETVSKAADKLMSNYISAVFGANPSIVLKQLGSVPMAAPYLGIGNFPSMEQIRNIDRELIAKYTSELEWRTMGYATPETKQLKNNPNWTERNKFFKFTFGGGAITAMDGWAASLLWPWAENKVRSEHADLQPGTDEFYAKVAQAFNDAVVRSQSVSDEMHQGTIRKSKNPITRTFTMFRSDAAQAYNALRQMIGEAKFYARTGADGKLIATSKKAVGGVVCALLLNAVWSEAVSFIMALWKNKGKYYRDEEEELNGQSVVAEMGRNMLESILGTVAGGDELAQLIGNAITGDKRYDLEAPGLEQLNDLLNMAQDLMQGNFGRIRDAVEVASNGGNVIEYYRKNSGEIIGELKDTAQKAATYFGIPVNNVEAYILGAMKWISPEFGAAYDDAFQNIDKADLKNLEGDALAMRLGRILKDRKITVSDDALAELAGLYEAGYTEAVPGGVPNSITIDGESKELNIAQKQAYERIWAGTVAGVLDQLIASDGFAEADQKTREKMLKYLYTYAGELAKAELFDGYEPDTRDETVEAYTQAGMDMVDFLHTYGQYSTLYSMDGSATEKATAFARWLDDQAYTAEQKAVIKEELSFYNMSPATAGKYDKMVAAGVDPDEAYAMTQEIGELEPMEGEDRIQDVQRWRECVNRSYKPETQMSLLYAYMTEKQFAKLGTAYTFGIDPDAFVGYYEIRNAFDEDGNGSYSNAEVKAAIDSMSKYKLSKDQKAVLWQLMTGSTSARNNPYSVSEGERVLKYLQES